jgi:hypothetical protein
VLIAVHNGGDYLQEAVASVLAQTDPDFELLLVDDASTDDAIERLPGDPRIRVLRNERNLGQVPSLNLGLREARGTFVARLDADDTMLPTRLERQAAMLEADERVALVGTWVDVVDEQGRLWATIRGDIADYAAFVEAVLSDWYPFGHPSLMLRRDVLLELGGYDASLAPSEDKDLYRRLVLARHEARVLREPLTRYRRHGGQLSQTQVERQLRLDHEGQERFLAALAPAAPAAALRELLAGAAELWAREPLAAGDVEALSAGAAEVLFLGGDERRHVERVIASRCARALRAGWAAPSPGYAARARPLVRYVRAHGDARARAALALQPALRATRPLGPPAAAARTGARRALRAERLAGLRAAARRSRALRRVYARVLGFKLLDD